MRLEGFVVMKMWTMILYVMAVLSLANSIIILEERGVSAVRNICVSDDSKNCGRQMHRICFRNCIIEKETKFVALCTMQDCYLR